MPLQTAYVVYPTCMGIPTETRTQKPNEILVSGPNGHYFITQEKRRVYQYEYFGACELGSGYAHLTKKDTIKMCQERLNERL